MSDTPDPTQGGLVVRTAQRYGVDPGKLLPTLKATCFKGNVTNEQMMSLLIVAEQHGLNPFTREIYAYPDKGGGIVPVVGIDGWLRIINEHPAFDGMETHWDNAEASMTCTIWRKDRSHPIVVTEYLAECRRNTDPWKMVHRMMRHKATMQCGRYAFGFAGIHDEEEAQDILRGTVPHGVQARERPMSNAERFRMPAEEVVDAVVTEPVLEPAPTPDPDPPVASHALADYLAALESTSPEELQSLMNHAATELDDDDYRTLRDAAQHLEGEA